MTEQELRESYKRARSMLDWEAIAAVFAAKGWVYYTGKKLGETHVPSVKDLQRTLDYNLERCLDEGPRETWCSSGRFKVSTGPDGVTIEGQVLVYLDKHSPAPVPTLTGAA
ncbi:MAG TPA: hypothetical protein VGK73_06780 [Polyangiaceae bacterium]